MSNVSKRRREGPRTKIKTMGDHKEFLNRITKTLYYGHLPTLPCLSLPVTEISCSVWSATQRGRSLRRLHADAAARVARGACVSPCALVLALLYLERLNACSPDYLLHAAPQDLFLISLMVGNKFLQDDGEDDEVIGSEWAASGGLDPKQLNKLELEFLDAINWDIFVSKESFEAGLSRLERQVALKQAKTRGFFTYSDLAAASGGAAGGELLLALGAAGRALAAAAGALLAAALLLAHAALPAMRLLASRSADLDLSAYVSPSSDPSRTFSSDPSGTFPSDSSRTFSNNATVEFAIDALVDELEASSRLGCCGEWSRRLERAGAAPRGEPGRGPEPRWPLAWLSSPLASPVRRWLERIAQYADGARCDGRERGPQRWLNLGKLSALLVAVSDR